MANLTIEEFKTIHQEWKQSGLTVREYCDSIGMKENKFYYWRHKAEHELLPQSTGSFIPMNPSGGIRLHKGNSIQGSGNDPLCEVVYPNGVTVRVNSDMTLEQLRQMITLIH